MGIKQRPRKKRPPQPRRPDRPRSGWRFADDEVERMLRSGEQGGLLEEYFGPEAYRELSDLAQAASAKRARGGPRVLLLPGIMGSKLGKRRKLLDDVLWIDPIEIAAGRLTALALPDRGRNRAVGVLLLCYLKLKLTLHVAGFDVAFHPFDWRQDIETLGRELAKRVAAEERPPVHLVAHSMGGLVARAALAVAPELPLGRLVMLGTPNYGSFAPVQAVRAEYPLARKIAALDLVHSAEKLAREVFATFPGLIEMLPSPERYSAVDLFDERSWPRDQARPGAAQLRRTREVQELLARADDRFFLVAGVNQPTVTGLSVEGSGADARFRYEESPDGDGTVPLGLAQLPGAKTWYVEESHGSLPNNGRVAHATIDLLERGTTERLAARPPASRGRAKRVVAPERLRAVPFEGRRGRELTADDLREILAEVAAPPARSAGSAPVPVADRAAAIASAGYAHPFDNVVIGRRRQRLVELRLAQGSITEVRSRAYVLGVFEGVDPAGAASAVDERIDGAIKEFTTRRMFSGYVGEVFVMPTGRSAVNADMVLLAGLGSVDGFDDEVQQFVAENVARTLVRTYVDEFATVLLGAGSGRSISRSLYNHLFGFFRGLREADHDHTLRRIVLCEYDAEKYLAMKEEIYRLASTSLFDEIQVTIDEVALPPPAPPPPSRRAAAGEGRDVMYLVVREEATRSRKRAGTPWTVRSTLLTPTGKAAIISGARSVDAPRLDALLAKIDERGFSAGRLPAFGAALARQVLDPEVTQVLRRNKEAHLVLVHDAPAARLPWETLCLDGWFPAAEGGLSRRYAADDLSVAKWLEERREDDELRILLVVNPTEDLDGARAEAEQVESAFRRSNGGRLEKLEGAEATRRALLTAFRSGRYDVIHYAGHAEFNVAQPSLSGVVCHGDELLTGADLAGLSKLPALVFFNACESGRIRGKKRGLAVERAPRGAERVRALIERNVGLAEAFLRGGVANYVGTYWPVGDAAASAFAETFYGRLVAGASVGEALREGRRKVRGLRSVDWADYVHYGAHDFKVKLR